MLHHRLLGNPDQPCFTRRLTQQAVLNQVRAIEKMEEKQCEQERYCVTGLKKEGMQHDRASEEGVDRRGLTR